MKQFLLVLSLCLIGSSIFPINSQAQWVATSIPIGYYGSYTTKDSNLFVGSWHGGVFRTTDNGNTWIDVSTGLTNYFTGDVAAIGNNLVAGTQTGGVFVSGNDGGNWIKADSFGVSGFAVSATSIYAATMDRGVMVSADGFGWIETDTLLTCQHVVRVAVKGSLIFAGTYGCGLFRSNNGGGNWVNVIPDTVMQSVNGLYVNGDDIYAAAPVFRDYWTVMVLRSSDDGATWTEADTGLVGDNIYAFAGSGNNMFAGTRGGGVFLSTNRGSSWTSVNQGLGDSYISGLSVTGLYLFASPSFNGGVYRRLISEMVTSVQKENSIIPEKYSLEQNYPNPFNPSTTINYQLSTQSHVTLKVFDVLGREVATLVDAVETSGYKSVNFDASGLSSGVYYYRLSAGVYVETKKLLLMK